MCGRERRARRKRPTKCNRGASLPILDSKKDVKQKGVPSPSLKKGVQGATNHPFLARQKGRPMLAWSHFGFHLDQMRGFVL